VTKKSAKKTSAANGANAANGESGAIGAIDPAQLDLLRRPQPAPEIVAAIAAATQLLLLPVGVSEAEEEPVHRTWRFSGRWWAQPASMRRSRPRVGR
jgi:hypothetical protein